MQNKNIKTQELLSDVVVMRLLLIALLIIYHSFVPFCGRWPMFENMLWSAPYRHMALISYSFFLEAFVFISGLIAGYQFMRRPDMRYNLQFVIKKARRLLIPSIIFSIPYALFFYDWKNVQTFTEQILSGAGHMWFLPMLFTCFLGLWLTARLNRYPWLILCLAVLIAWYPVKLFYLIDIFCQYFLFFMAGYFSSTLRLRDKIKPRTLYIAISLAIFIPCMALELLNPDIIHPWKIYQTILLLKKISGLTACYLIIWRTVPSDLKLPDILIRLSSYAFGIYICQEFILKWLYYHTPLTHYVVSAAVPWIGICMASILSVVGTHYMLKTRAGRFLVG